MMEDWQQYTLDEKVDLEQLILTSSDSYMNETSKREYSEEINEGNIDDIDNSAEIEIKTEKVEMNDEESIAKPLEYFTNGNEEICQICGLEFGNKAVLKIHNSFVHPEGNKDDQNKDCVRKDESVQEKMKPLKGTIYEYKAWMKSGIKRQVVSVHEKPFKCNICNFEFSYDSNLKNHIDSVHKGIKEFKCNICEYKTAYKHHLEKHIESNHEGNK